MNRALLVTQIWAPCARVCSFSQPTAWTTVVEGVLSSGGVSVAPACWFLPALFPAGSLHAASEKAVTRARPRYRNLILYLNIAFSPKFAAGSCATLMPGGVEGTRTTA